MIMHALTVHIISHKLANEVLGNIEVLILLHCCHLSGQFLHFVLEVNTCMLSSEPGLHVS